VVDLNAQYDQFRAKGLGVAIVSYDSVAILKNFSDRKSIRIPMLSDPESKIIRAFGILNDNVEKTSPVYGIPFPGTYVLDAKGIVKSKYFHDDFTERFSAGSVLTREFGAAGQTVTHVDTPHIALSYTASDAAFSPGRRITLIVDLDFKPKMHVYAPGVEGGYLPIDWKMAKTKGWAALDAEYPAAREAHLTAINDTVPVYDRHVRITRDIIVGQSAEVGPALAPDRTLTVDGTFRYQACDDIECYVPRVIPLQWKFKVGEMETERVPAEIRRRP
jgi:hypothetical protein